jgi:CBS domain containing-hemolysin-like protein
MLIEEASARVIDLMHSRVPVYDESRGPEHIIGVVYSKDLARLMYFRPSVQRQRAEEAEEKRSGALGLDSEPSESRSSLGRRYPATPFVELRVKQVMHDVLVVPETKTVLDLIRDFQQRRRQMAIVVDEYGSTSGLVTAEDAIEQLTGELEDEFDDPARPLITTATGVLMLDGGVNLRDLETQMQWSLPRDGGIETLAGFLLMRLGHIPKAGESVDYEDRRLTVVAMDGRRISKIRVEPLKEAANAAG